MRSGTPVRTLFRKRSLSWRSWDATESGPERSQASARGSVRLCCTHRRGCVVRWWHRGEGGGAEQLFERVGRSEGRLPSAVTCRIQGGTVGIAAEIGRGACRERV